jgi:hypothetical protein
MRTRDSRDTGGFSNLNIWTWTKRIFVFSLLIFIWIASFYLARVGFAGLPRLDGIWDLTAVLFSAAQICFFAISIIIAFLAIFGFQYFEGKIRESVERETTNRLANLEKEARGRSFAILGYTIGESSVKPDFSEPTDRARLEEAIRYCDQAYGFLKGTNLPTEFMALNNLLIYSCALRGRYKTRSGYLLEGARRLRKGAEEHDNQNLLLTYCHTVLEFSYEPRELEEACSIFKVILGRDDINEKQKREVEFLTSRFKERGLFIDPMS